MNTLNSIGFGTHTLPLFPFAAAVRFFQNTATNQRNIIYEIDEIQETELDKYYVREDPWNDKC